MKTSISKDTPLAEISLRRYEKPSLKGRDLVRKFCLSIGVLQPGDSRDVIVDVLMAVLQAKKEISSEEVKEEVVKIRRKEKLALRGIASSNIRRQLKRLRDLHLIETVGNNYRVTENAPISDTFSEKIEGYLINSILSRVKEYAKAIDKEFNK